MTDKLMDTESVLERMAEAIDGCGYEIYDLSRPKAKAALAASGLLEEVERLKTAAHAPELDAAHDALEALLEDDDATAREIRDATITLCAHLREHRMKREAAREKATAA